MKEGILLLAIFAILAGTANAADEFIDGELLVGFQPGTRGAQADRVLNGLGATRIKAWPQISAEHWRLPPGLSVAQAVQALSHNPNVLYAEPNYIVHAVTAVPDDPLRSQMWGVHNIGQTGGTPGADIDALEAWQVPPASSPVVVGVIDTGVDYTHEDLAGSIWSNPGEISGNGIDDDGNGHIDDVRGWDFVNNDNDPMDDYGHGTHVSGTIAARGNNGIGVIGVAGLNLNVKIMPLKFIASNGYGSNADATSAILYAASFKDAFGKNIVRLTSNSWGGGGKSKTLETAIKNCGALFVAAAGNDGSNSLHYPAAYSAANIVSVAATDNNDALASFSNFGSDWVDVAAPGVSILSTTPGNNYASWDGTSMATPHVSGVAALLISQYSSWTIDQIKAQILASADPLASLAGKVLTGARLNAAKALGAPELPPDTMAPGAVADLAASPASATSVTLAWTAPGDDANTGRAYIYDLRFSGNPISTEADFADAGRVQAEPNPQTPGAAETFTINNLADNRPWYFALKTIDDAGNASDLSNLASALLPQATWHYLTLEAGENMGNQVSQSATANGWWAVAYDDSTSSLLRCAYLLPSGQAYARETVGSGGIGPSLAYSPAEEISISHVDAAKRLWFAIKTGSTWTSTQVEAKDLYPYATSLGYKGATPIISYYKTTRRASGLYFAQRIGGTWSTQLLDPGALAIYNQLAVSSAGDVAIAYSSDSNGDGAVDTLKIARSVGAGWNIAVVEVGGAYGTVAFDPVTTYPAVAHWDAATGRLRFLRWTGTAWSAPETVDIGSSIKGCSLAIGPDGKAFLAYGSDAVRLAIRDPFTGVWTGQVVDASTTGSLRNSLAGRPGSNPGGLAYRGPEAYGFYPTSVVLAIRQVSY